MEKLMENFTNFPLLALLGQFVYDVSKKNSHHWKMLENIL